MQKPPSSFLFISFIATAPWLGLSCAAEATDASLPEVMDSPGVTMPSAPGMEAPSASPSEPAADALNPPAGAMAPVGPQTAQPASQTSTPVAAVPGFQEPSLPVAVPEQETPAPEVPEPVVPEPVVPVEPASPPVEPGNQPEPAALEPVQPEPAAPEPAAPEPAVPVPPQAPITPAPPSGVANPEPDEIIGFAAGTTGGAGGPEVVVTSIPELLDAVATDGPVTITVQGQLVHNVSGGGDDARIWVTSNKTIQGADSTASVDGNFTSRRDVENVIIRNINLMNPEGKGTGDAMEFTNSCNKIWVNHVTFHQSKDGSLDFKRGCDNITVSWCKFAYTSATHGHNYANLIGHVDGWITDRGKLNVTMHHNWYPVNVIERMPRVRYGKVHVFNNYYSSNRTNYVIGVGVESQILLEASYFENQGGTTWFKWFGENSRDVKCGSPDNCGDGQIQWTEDNVFDQTAVSTWAENSDVFDPPYEYKHVLQTAHEARESVMERAGVLPD